MFHKFINIFRVFFKRFFTISFNNIGALEITDGHLRYFGIYRGKKMNINYRLPPEIIFEGKIIDERRFNELILAIRKKLLIKKRVYTIVTLPSVATYFQVFNLPYLEPKDLEDAINLNLELVSPLQSGEAYSTFQVIDNSSDKYDIIGIFSDKKSADVLLKVCNNAGISVIALEPDVLALVRALLTYGGADFKEPTILLSTTDFGMNFSLLRQNSVYFNYAVAWRTIYGEVSQISKEKFEETIINYMTRVLTYANAQGVKVELLYLISSGLNEQIITIIKKQFGNLKIVDKREFPEFNLGSEWGVAIGAYARGIAPDFEDKEPSLINNFFKKELLFTYIVNFTILFKTILLSIFAGILIIFGIFMTYLSSYEARSTANTPLELKSDILISFEKLTKEAENFNVLVDTFKNTKLLSIPLYPFIESITNLTKDKIIIESLFFTRFDEQVILQGIASNDDDILSLKRALESSGKFREVTRSLPSAAATNQDKVRFSLKFFLINPNDLISNNL